MFPAVWLKSIRYTAGGGGRRLPFYRLAGTKQTRTQPAHVQARGSGRASSSDGRPLMHIKAAPPARRTSRPAFLRRRNSNRLR